jgi:hypothetical protein
MEEAQEVLLVGSEGEAIPQFKIQLADYGLSSLQTLAPGGLKQYLPATQPARN